MKHFTLGIIKHNCSTAMKRGKFKRICEKVRRVWCPICKKKMLKVVRV